jgi:hypothetical protein
MPNAQGLFCTTIPAAHCSSPCACPTHRASFARPSLRPTAHARVHAQRTGPLLHDHPCGPLLTPVRSMPNPFNSSSSLASFWAHFEVCVPVCKIRTAAKLRACLHVCRPHGAAARPRYGRRPPINMATMCLWFPCIFFKYYVRPEFSTTSRCPPARLLRRRCSPRPSRSALRCAHPPPHAEEMRAEFAPIGGLTCAAGG